MFDLIYIHYFQMDDDTAYSPDIVESLVTHLPPGKVAVASSCEEPRVILRHSDPFTHPKYSLYKLRSNALGQCRGWLVGWSGAVYSASAFDDSIVTYLSTLPKECFFYDDVSV